MRDINRLAALQHGCVHRGQLLDAGIGQDAIDYRLHSGALHRLHRAVYLVGRAETGSLTREMAAVLCFRGFAVLGARSAGFVWKMVDQQPPIVEVIARARASPRPRKVECRQSGRLGPQDVRWRSDLPLTSPARTLVDLAGVIDAYELENALAQALRRGLVKQREIMDEVSCAPARTRGIGLLRGLVEAGRAPADTRSVYERRLLRLVRDAGLPEPIANAHVQGHMVDLYWPGQQIVVEFDSWKFHSDRRSFEADRLRDLEFAAAGIRVLRVTARQLDGAPTRTVAVLAAAFARGQKT